MPITETRKEFKIVVIPADTNEPVVELTVPITKGAELEAMTSFVKEHLAKQDTARKARMDQSARDAERQAMVAQVEEAVKKQPQLAGVKITDEILDKLLGANNVDSIPLLTNKKSNGYIAVNMYVDDQGVAKKLPTNLRASSLCAAVQQPLQVLGDAFIGRYFDDDDDFLRHDFTMADLAADAPWIKEAVAAKRAAGGASSGSSPKIYTANAATATPAGAAAAVDKSRACCAGTRGCKKAAPLRCGACKSVWYCSQEHQKADWPRHKTACKKA